ncbi:ATP-binding protein [Kocuria sp. U4B]
MRDRALPAGNSCHRRDDHLRWWSSLRVPPLPVTAQPLLPPRRPGSSDDNVEVHVADQGMGMAPGDAEQVFTRFFRSPGARMSAIPGMGLAVAHDIVVGHGETITCASTLGAGTTVTLTLPRTGLPAPLTAGHQLVPTATTTYGAADGDD